MLVEFQGNFLNEFGVVDISMKRNGQTFHNLHTLFECPKIEYGRHFHGNEPRELFSPSFFILVKINVQSMK